MTTNYRFKQEIVRPHDIFVANHFDANGMKKRHYFYCTYSQEQDRNNGLFADVIGLMITTKKPMGYFVQIVINKKTSYVCIDKEFRFRSEKGVVENIMIRIPDEKRREIYENFQKLNREKQRQMRGGLEQYESRN